MVDNLDDQIDWELTTFDGVRRKHHKDFRALSLREKIQAIEDMQEVVEFFAAKRRARANEDRSKRDDSGG